MDEDTSTTRRAGGRWRAILVAVGLIGAAFLALQSGPYGTESYDISAGTSWTAPIEETGARTVFADTAAVLVLDDTALAMALGEEVRRLLEGAAPDLDVALHCVPTEPYAPGDDARLADLLVTVDVETDEVTRRFARLSRTVRAMIMAGRSPLRASDVRGTALWCTRFELDVEVRAETGGLYGGHAVDRKIARLVGGHWSQGLEDLDVRPAQPAVEGAPSAALDIPFEVPGRARPVYAGRRADGSTEAAWILDVEGSHTDAYEAILASAEANGWRSTGGSRRPGGRPNTLAMERDGDLALVEFARRPDVLRQDPDSPERFAITLRRAP